MTSTNPKVDAFIDRARQWQDEMRSLRALALDAGLTEEIKWGKPSYSFDGANVCILQPFKESIALMFFKGALLKDPTGVLEPPGENSRIARRIQFSGIQQIADAKKMLKGFIAEAIEAEKAGLEVDLSDEPEPELAEELQAKLDEMPDLKAAFESLTPGRQRAYNLYISGAKQSKTRESRVEKHVDRILAGKGLND